MVRMLLYFFIVLFYSLLTTGEIQSVPEKFVPQTVRNFKELSANFQPLLTPSLKNPSNNRKNLREALRGYSDQEIQRMLDIASAQ
jgi:hypothetical protein